MEARTYVTAFLERLYMAEHPDLTAAARELVHEEIPQRPEKYATSEHAQALVSYLEVHERLIQELERIDELPDAEFEQQRNRLFDEAREAFAQIARTDQLCVDAALVGTLLANISIDACITELLKLEQRVHEHLQRNVEDFDDEAPHFWNERALERRAEREGHSADAAARTMEEPEFIGWLHTLEALAQLCLASARYRAAEGYARTVLRAAGYPSRQEGTVFLVRARLEDDEGFFEFAHELEATRPNEAAVLVDDSPWFLLGRTLLLYKTGRRRPAKRALRDFAARCEGGAFFLLNPTYMMPYLPVRPPAREPWNLAHQAVWEADGIIVDTPDFAAWAESIEGIRESSEDFAKRYGF